MNPNEALTLARDIADEFGLTGVYTVRLDSAKRRFGRCQYAPVRIISLSKALVEVNDRPEVEDTIRHEVAHALAGPFAGHGPAWQAWCRRVGAKPQRCYSQAEVNTVPAPWSFECGKGCKGTRFRKPKTRMACKRHRIPIVWRAT